MMVAAKSEDLEFSPPYLGNFSKGDAQSQTMSFSVQPYIDSHLSAEAIKVGPHYLNNLTHINSMG
jgi:hypothetical protein